MLFVHFINHLFPFKNNHAHKLVKVAINHIIYKSVMLRLSAIDLDNSLITVSERPCQTEGQSNALLRQTVAATALPV